MTKSEAIKHFGSASKLARALRISRAAVSRWPENTVPALRQFQLEALTGGKLTADPDLKMAA